ncbi:DUF2628 domain-containing protein [Burkholderia sp. FERM BP-3421]|jgi:hypothetical protein|uniref:DUF2628 domain-containing protein n=1 Tax=Burkholderia sp. FERM BP-3421 TaxID=1494466 RepID=UPI00235EB912|nr:DUF2628 domain-containing protein [Burkholderia sp. FERM BP-3421]WDD94480.1 DUF2628 domain-containing protein [Burkholderia sp. FERM BP-3421]
MSAAPGEARAEKPQWRERFAFYDAYGAPSSPAYRAAFKALPFGKRLGLGLNVFALLLGPVYYFALGMWRKGISLLLLVLAIGALETVFEMVTGIEVPTGVDVGINVGCTLLFGICANYAYYLKVRGRDGWNPFEGMRLI